MTRRALFSLVCFLLPILCLFAEGKELVLRYAESSVRLKDQDGWITLSLGESIPFDSVIAIEADGIVDFSSATESFVLGKKGIYHLAAIAVDRKDALSNPVGAKLLSLFGAETVRKKPAVMGVRGDKVSTVELQLREAQEAIESGDFDAAASIANSALEDEDDSRQALVYISSLSLCKLGREREALKRLRQEDLDPFQTYFKPLAVLYLSLLLQYGDPSDYEDELALLKPFLPELQGE